MSQPEDEGFEALLKPIQDLTRNWDVDLCLHLEEYINYIRQICGESSNVDMNFAQAAVLVQNSANIYSKKVDFLFSTVHQLLDNLSKKQKEKQLRESQEEDGGQPGTRRRKAAAVLETEDFEPFGQVCSDRCLTLNLEKEKKKLSEKKKPKIVLNAAIKVKPKDKTSCTVYSCASEIMGRKDEFRLNWRICSAGTLHEEFVINKNKFTSIEPVELSVCNNDQTVDDGIHMEDDNHSDHSEDSGVVDPQEPAPPLSNSMFTLAPTTCDRESEVGGAQPLAQARKGVIKPVDVDMIDWQPNDFNVNLPEKKIKKRKVTKLPPGLDDDKKRKYVHEGDTFISFTITDVFFKSYNNCTFGLDGDLSYQCKLARLHRRQLMLNHRAKYQAYLEKEAGIEQTEDFHGFINPEDESDNEQNFEGFDNPDNDNDDADDVDVNILDAGEGRWKGDDPTAYHNTAAKTLQEFKERRRLIDHERKSELNRIVDEWGKKIKPKLNAAKKRQSFDIHKYGTRVLNTFSGNIGEVKPFEEIVAGKSKEEVARYFLASLVLTNQNNLELTESEPGDLNVDCVQLKLLSVARHQDEMDENLKKAAIGK